MPAIALVGAAASIKVGLAVSGLLGGMMVAGGVMTGLGAITGNKKLTRIGAVLGLAGGIGNMISSAGSAASGLGQAVDATGGLETATSFGASDLAAATTGSGALDFSGAFTSPVESASGIVGSQIAPPGSVESFYGEVPTDSMMQAPADTATMAPGAAEANAARDATQAGAAQQGIQVQGVGGNATKTVGSTAQQSAFGKLGDWAGKGMDHINNPKNANTVKLGSGLVSGAMKSYDQQRQYDQQLAQREAERARFNRSIIGQYVTR